jgi:hypothetical protein
MDGIILHLRRQYGDIEDPGIVIFTSESTCDDDMEVYAPPAPADLRLDWHFRANDRAAEWVA